MKHTVCRIMPNVCVLDMFTVTEIILGVGIVAFKCPDLNVLRTYSQSKHCISIALNMEFLDLKDLCIPNPSS